MDDDDEKNHKITTRAIDEYTESSKKTTTVFMPRLPLSKLSKRRAEKGKLEERIAGIVNQTTRT